MAQLDVLRGVAILLVLFTHSTVQPADSGVLAPVLEYLRYLGPSGVDLVFVLSGFHLVPPLSKLGTGVSLELRWVVSFALYVCVATAAGVLFASLVDKPSLRVRERLFPSRTSLPIVTRDVL